MKRAITKIGRKMLGSLVACSLLFSVLPGMMLLADDAAKSKTGSVPIQIDLSQMRPTSGTSGTVINHGGTGNYSGFSIFCSAGTDDGNDSKIKYEGNQLLIKARRDGRHSEYTFTINTDNPYYNGGIITGMTVELGGFTEQCTINLGGAFSGTLPNTGATLESAPNSTNSIVLGLSNSTTNNSVYVEIKSITIYVSIPATGITITDGTSAIGDAITMNAGENLSLDATIAPTTSTYLASWEVTSASPDGCITIAQSTTDNTVTVTAVSPGTATLQASAGTGITDTVTITVNPAKVTSISYDHDDLALTVGETHAVTNIAVQPDDKPTYSIEWISTNTNVATVSDTGVITAAGIGTATVYARCTNGSTTTTGYVYGPDISV